MVANYFPKTDIEYGLYFQIDDMKRAKRHNLNRLDLLNRMSDDGWGKLTNDPIMQVNQLNDVFIKIISKDDIEDIDTYYSYYNAALLLNRKIELTFLGDEFKGACQQILGDNFKKDYDLLFSVGNILFPKGNLIRSILSHSAKFFLVAWIAGLIVCCAYILRGEMNLLENFLVLIGYVAITMIPYLFINKLIIILRKNRIEHIGFGYAYQHNPINPDFLTNVLTNAGISKLNRL